MIKNGIQIIGTQRSGSNLLRVILDQSEEIASPHPPHILVTFMPLLHLYGDLDLNSYSLLVADVVKYVEANPVPWEGVKLNSDEIIAQSKTYDLLEINRLVYEKAALAKNAKYWCCKSMANVHFAEEMEAFGLTPKYVYLYRDGRDVACSFKKAVVGEKHVFFIAEQWKKDQEACLQLQQKLPNDRFFALNYEDLIADPEKKIKELCGFLAISYHPNMMSFYNSRTSKLTAAAGEMWSNLEKPIIKDNTQKFLKELDQEELSIFETVAGDTLAKLNYQLFSDETNVPLITEELITAYDIENKQLKKQALVEAKKSDLENREAQLRILSEIKSRPILAKEII